MVKFGDVILPLIQHITRRKRRIFDSKTIVGRSIAAKRDAGSFGREFIIQGVLTGVDMEAKMLELMALAGQKRTLDFEDGSDALLCLMLNPRFVRESDKPSRYFYELTFSATEVLKKLSIVDHVGITELLVGAFLGEETRLLQDYPQISELLAGALMAHITAWLSKPSRYHWSGSYGQMSRSTRGSWPSTSFSNIYRFAPIAFQSKAGYCTWIVTRQVIRTGVAA